MISKEQPQSYLFFFFLNDPPPPKISPLPHPAPLPSPQPFSASVKNVMDQSVTWSVNGTAGGDTTVGKISATGLYTAPAALPSPASVSVKATSVDRKSTRLNSSHGYISYAVFCLKKKKA